MTDQEAPLSIIIPVYNGASVIKSTLDSIVKQKDIHCEIIIVNDCSSDNTLDVLEEWSSRHPGQILKVIDKPERELTLKARLSGIEIATGPDIIFLDADDEFLYTYNIAKILKKKREGGFEIAHFRSQFLGEQRGEANWNAPMSAVPLYGREVFATYATKFFPPVLAWGKIYSTSLLKEALPLARQLEIRRLEDVFFISLIMLLAKSYCPMNEFAYLYHVSDNWPMEKYGVRVQDLAKMCPFFQKITSLYNVEQEVISSFMAFIKRRLQFNMNGFCRELADLFESDMDLDELMEKVRPFSMNPPESLDFLAILCSTFARNINKFAKMDKRLMDDKGIFASCQAT